MPKISVIMCAYNSEKTLRRAVDCLVNQSLKDIEIILVNDGSTDGTLKIMRVFEKKDPRVRIVSHENMGHGLARNTGIEIASGEYLAFMDSDDTLETDAFEKMYQKTENGLYDIVVCNSNRIFPDKIHRKVREVPDRIFDLRTYGRKKYIERFLISYRHEMGVFNKLIRRSLMVDHHIVFPSNKEMLYDDVLPIMELVCVANTIVSYNHAFYNYYINEGSLSDMQNTASKMPYTFPKLVEAFRNFVEENELMGELGELLPLYYYTQVYFGLIRAKRFGHADISGSSFVLSEFQHYDEYMRAFSRLSQRLKLVTHVAPGLSIFKSFPMIGLCWLTLIQGGLVARYALKGQYAKIDKIL